MEFENIKEYISILSSDGIHVRVPNCGLFSLIDPKERVSIHSKYFKFINGEIEVPKSEIIEICQLLSSLSISIYDQIIKSKLYKYFYKYTEDFSLDDLIKAFSIFPIEVTYSHMRYKYENDFFNFILDFVNSANKDEEFDNFLIRVDKFLKNRIDEHLKDINVYKHKRIFCEKYLLVLEDIEDSDGCPKGKYTHYTNLGVFDLVSKVLMLNNLLKNTHMEEN